MVQANACLEEIEEKEHCFNFFKFSPYWAHPENILLALLSDENLELRNWAVNKIKEVRQINDRPKSEYFKDDVRTWKKPALVFPLSEHYKDMMGKQRLKSKCKP